MLGLLLLLLTAFAAPAMPTLDAETRALLAQGEVVVLPAAPGSTAARALVRIDSTPDRVWKILSDPQHLQASSRSVKSLTLYKDEVRPDGKREQRLAYVLKVALSEVRYNVVRVYDIDQGRMTWTLDPDRDNDLVATDGSFTIWKDGDGILFGYEATVDSGRNVPQWILDELTQASLKRFMRYVQEAAAG